jgi:hypothetical protein
VKFRRKSSEPEALDDSPEAAEGDAAQAAVPSGPYDVDDLPDDGLERVDLGSLLVAPEPDRELRVQVDEASGAVQSVLLAGTDGALELRAFAAPRGGDLWSEVRPQIAAEMSQRGGVTSQREGRFGTELVCRLTVRLEDGTTGEQPSRVIGINGPRWLLRATLLGRPAVEVDGPDAAVWEESLARVAVRRGSHAMPVGDALPLALPAQARQVEPPTA